MATLPFLVPPVVPPCVGCDPVVVYRWLFEAWLVRVRWWILPPCLFLAPLVFPTVPWPLALLPALGLGASNVWIGRLLDDPSDPKRLRSARWFATGLNWVVGLTGVGLSVYQPHSLVPAGLLVLMLITGLRHGLLGLLRAALLVALAALLGGGMLRAQGDWYRWEVQRVEDQVGSAGRQEGERLERQAAAVRRLESGLSVREWELLPWLAREDLTYQAIAAELHICESTVKAHARHIGEKLEAKGRRRVVLVARQHGLLPPGA
jgi:DNA-binding CsgD family transcriptional regulator